MTPIAITPVTKTNTVANAAGRLNTRWVRRKSQTCVTSRHTMTATSSSNTPSCVFPTALAEESTRLRSALTNVSSGGSASSRSDFEPCRRYAAPIGNP